MVYDFFIIIYFWGWVGYLFLGQFIGQWFELNGLEHVIQPFWYQRSAYNLWHYHFGLKLPQQRLRLHL